MVLKVARQPSDEWLAGWVTAAFGGRGMVRVLECAEGAMLLEEIRPGYSLAKLAQDDSDAEATTICARVIASMTPGPAPAHVPSAVEWGRGFERYRISGGREIPPDLLTQAHQLYGSLAATQRTTRLLHGDLHHHNILRDSARGWLAIDPKGVDAELEFEVGAWLRNPGESPDLYLQSSVINRRVQCFQATLAVQPDRVLQWAFAQGVLSAIWTLEDLGTLPPDHAGLALARLLRDHHGVVPPEPGSFGIIDRSPPSSGHPMP